MTMNYKQARKAVERDIEKIAYETSGPDYDRDPKNRELAMLTGFSDLLLKRSLEEHKERLSEHECSVVAVAGLIRTLIKASCLSEDTVLLYYAAMLANSNRESPDDDLSF